ncbi:RagB/SusD family nutrient uptake outer membrane protein [Gelidibacter salicanalis]|uniref:RagB/SusD family nutrient uptake outer membrane protein n=1 Tax=Gelidibacter salicanalis TaxID=291193 RepID=A0A934KPA6_9FLAO|nr:RagB/SusD family nutrient uptake outer membrane protein [Gelidibacter salicanalis]MBJ7882996.1 RagB/SusD family nutrient uptake outer membrane protein [Gelidibacter salicanalis]
MKIKFVLAVVFSAFLLQGCDDQLEIEQKDNITAENLYNTKAGALAGLAGAYSRVVQVYRDAIINAQYPTDWTDEGFYNRKGLQNILKNNFTASDPTLGNIWSDYYSGIAAANSLLIGLEGSPLEEDVKLEFEAEARFLRAFLFFDLEKAFGGIEGIPMPLEDDYLNKALLPRTKGIDVYKQIISDLEFAEQHLPSAALATGGRGNKSAARGLLARAYIFMATKPFNEAGAYEKAKEWSKKVIDDPYHVLNPIYADIFNELARGNYETKETLFQIGFSEDVAQQQSKLGSGFGMKFDDESCALKGARLKGKSYAQTYATVTLVLKYRNDPTDERGLWNTLPFFNARNEDCQLKLEGSQFSYASSKYRRYLETDPTNTSYGSHHWPVLRLSEMYLIYAEAQNAIAPGSTEAIDAINMVRNRANATPVEEVNDEVIQEEYLLELAFEGHRKFDLVRWGILEQKVNETESRMKTLEADPNFMNDDWVTFGTFSLDSNDLPIITRDSLNTTPRRNTMSGNFNYYDGYDDFEPSKNYILPIPAQELGVNTNLKQNSGW